MPLHVHIARRIGALAKRRGKFLSRVAGDFANSSQLWCSAGIIKKHGPSAGGHDDGLSHQADVARTDKVITPRDAILAFGKPRFAPPAVAVKVNHLLDKVPGVTPLRADGLKQLEGKQVCALVYDSDISINYDPLDGSLKGANLGIVAFKVISVTARSDGSSSSLPEVEIEILDAEDCDCDTLTLFMDAPEPISSSEPFDVDP